MNKLIANRVNGTTLYSGIKMIVCDMAGTTINEGGLVYKTLYDTMKNFNLDVNRKDIDYWYGANKYEVLEHYLKKSTKLTGDQFSKTKHSLFFEFDNNLKFQYFSSPKVRLIHDDLPNLFNEIRKNGIKIALNTGYNREIQSRIIQNLYMNEFIDDFISSQDVSRGRPYPYMIDTLMHRNSISDPKTVIKLGDSKNDIIEGINSKCRSSIGVLTGADKEDELSKYTLDIVESIMSLDVI